MHADFARRLKIAEELIFDEQNEVVREYVTHHLECISPEYWRDRLGKEKPSVRQVIQLLKLKSAWGEDDIEYFDFILPGEVTDYVVSVQFNSDGTVASISMDS